VLVRGTFSSDGSDAAPGRTEAPQRSGTPPQRNWGAFHGTDLDLHLRRRGVTQIVLGGVATSIGV
jgi:nicotinamidase-related amidase